MLATSPVLASDSDSDDEEGVLMAVIGALVCLEEERAKLAAAQDDPIDARIHGNSGSSIPDRSGNYMRDETIAEKALLALSDPEFMKRFKASKERFWWLVDTFAAKLEPDGMEQKMAIVSSGNGVPASLQLAVTLR